MTEKDITEEKQGIIEREPVPRNWKPLIFFVAFIVALTASIALAAALTNLHIYPDL